MNWKVLAIAAAASGYLAWDLARRIATRHNRGIARSKRIVVLGGGFAGIEACRELEKLLPGDDNGEIVLVDESGYLLFTPMLTEAVGGAVKPNHIIVPLASYTKRTKVIVGEVQSIDLSTRSIEIKGHEVQKLQADHLVISLGATSNFHHLSGVEKSALTVKTLDDANRIREGALALLRSAVRESDSSERKAMLTFIVAGGGYTGVETIAALNELIRGTAARFGKFTASDIYMLLVEPAGRLMSEVTEDLASYTQKQLEADGIRVLIKTGIQSADGDTVTLTNGETLRTRTLIWSAGVEANALVSRLPGPKGKNKGLRVEANLSLPGHAGVWVVGDCAEIPEPKGNGFYGATAQNATREGILAAQNIVRSLRGQQLRPFRYTPMGELALIGRHRGVARIYNFNFSGFTAYVLWRLVYIAKLPSMTQRLRVISDWILDASLGPAAELPHTFAASAQKKLEPPEHRTASA